jgi:hypothetical protein
MKVKIISPTRSAMQSGLGKSGDWTLMFPPEAAPDIDPLMGWTGMPDTTQQLRINFNTQEEAIDYAQKNGLEFEVVEPKKRLIKPKSYSANFAFKLENRT